MTLCRCCFVSSIPEIYSATDRPVLLCAECGTHWGQPEKTALSHEKMMSALREANAGAMERLDDRREALAVRLAAAEAQVSALIATIASDYSEHPARDIRNLVDQAIVDKATRRADSEAKAKDRAMAVVFRLDRLHHEDGVNCSCGKRITECEEYSALNAIRPSYYAWEKLQLERLAEGKPHGLPVDHPQA
jgi:hypothetical protein